MELGDIVYPESATESKGWRFYFYLIFVIINIFQAIGNFADGDWFWVILESIFAVVFLCFLIFLQFGTFLVLKHGFRLNASFYNKFIYNVPDIVNINEIIAITPVYGKTGKILTIENFKFYYTRENFFLLPKKNLHDYIKVILKNFKSDWTRLYNEKYDIENIDWQDVYQRLFLTEKRIIIYSFTIGFAVFGVAIILFLLFISKSGSTEFTLGVIGMFLAAMQVGLAIGKIWITKNSEKLLVLIRFIKDRRITSVPTEITDLPVFHKWNDKFVTDGIEYIDTFDTWYKSDGTPRKDIIGGGKEIVNPELVQKRVRGMKIRMVAVIVVVVIVTSIVFLSIFFINPDYEYFQDGIPKNGQFQFQNRTELSDKMINVNDNFIVLDGGRITLVNITLNWILSDHGEGGLYVEEGGYLEAQNCIFEGANSQSTYKCELYGEVKFRNCTFTHLWGDRDEISGQGGIEIYSDDVLLDYCEIYDARVSGIVIGDCSPRIANSIITGCFDDGIEVFGGAPTIINNIITNNDDGIMTYKSNCRAVITGNTITNNDSDGVGIFDDSKAKVYDNQISNNGDYDVNEGSSSTSIILMVPIIMIVIIVTFTVLVLRKTRNRMKEEVKKLDEDKWKKDKPY